MGSQAKVARSHHKEHGRPHVSEVCSVEGVPTSQGRDGGALSAVRHDGLAATPCVGQGAARPVEGA